MIPFENMSAEATALADNIPYKGSPIEKLGEGAIVMPASDYSFDRELEDDDERIGGEGYDGIHEGEQETGDKGVRSRGVRGQGITMEVGGTRREEIRAFLTARFKHPKDEERKARNEDLLVTGLTIVFGKILTAKDRRPEGQLLKIPTRFYRKTDKRLKRICYCLHYIWYIYIMCVCYIIWRERRLRVYLVEDISLPFFFVMERGTVVSSEGSPSLY